MNFYDDNAVILECPGQISIFDLSNCSYYDRVSILIKEKQALINRLNNHKSLLERAKSKYELNKINNEIH